jgi:hypothetical protein
VIRLPASSRLEDLKVPIVRIALSEDETPVSAMPCVDQPALTEGECRAKTFRAGAGFALVVTALLGSLVVLLQMCWNQRVGLDHQTRLPTQYDLQLAQMRGVQIYLLVLGCISGTTSIVLGCVAHRLGTTHNTAPAALNSDSIIIVPRLMILGFEARARRLKVPLARPGMSREAVLADYFAPHYNEVHKLLPAAEHLEETHALLDPDRRQQLTRELLDGGRDIAEATDALIRPQIEETERAALAARQEAELTARLRADALLEQIQP